MINNHCFIFFIIVFKNRCNKKINNLTQSRYKLKIVLLSYVPYIFLSNNLKNGLLSSLVTNSHDIKIKV